MARTEQDKRTKYEINVEGTLYDWDKPTINVPELRQLGNLPADQPVVRVDLKANAEETLLEDAVIELKPGQGFGRKVSFKRG